MKIAVMGAGAVGSYFGALMIKAGFDVTLIGRGAHLKAMQEKGLLVKSVNGDFEVKPKAVGSPEECGPVDFILFTVKSYDTEEAIKLCDPLFNDSTFCLSIQNGVDNESRIAQVVGEEKVLFGLTWIGAEIASPGIVNHNGRGIIEFGEENGVESERVLMVKGVFEKSNIPFSVSDNIVRAKWKKFLWNVGYNQVCAATRKNCGEVVRDPESFEMLKGAVIETTNVANAKGVALSDIDVKRVLDLSLEFGKFRPSMLQDLEKGKRLEVEAFSGAVIKYGKELGIPTPVNKKLYEILKGEIQ